MALSDADVQKQVHKQSNSILLSLVLIVCCCQRTYSNYGDMCFMAVLLAILSIHCSLNNSGVMYLYKLYLRYSTGFGERELRPFREEPEAFISILISTTPMHLEPFVVHSALPARPQPLVIQESSTC